MKTILKSLITCPYCKVSREEIMPADACQFFYKCSNCEVVVKPLEGDCCVFCSYGSVPCPPIQESRSCCSHSD
ncbi:GDCCVxC domain-containing (seleno)protein [Salinimicrobium sp. HB62]|uniref:GDCCVxC domain-containing (seleno)protein n=1 Tax=Salinimicrobium sp. HB62 TaxID=3077781 RepID=UPI002D795091|nr:GDCCVxC domain-containing (seleno)protein [Salinimicrobium sp. HB62]